MLAVAALFTLLQLASVRADPTPLEPDSTSVFNQGSQCNIQWTADPTGVWKVMNIELMTGSNEKMVHLRTVGTVDGTSTTNNTYSYTCLAVNPNSQIYFYQVTSPFSTDVLWTTRFTIADTSGKSVPPELQETNSSGEIIHYGIGSLQDQSLVDSPPAYGTNVTGAASSSTAGASTGTGPPNPTVTGGVTTTGTVTRDNNGNDNDTQSTSATSSTAQPSQSKTGGAVSYQHIASVGTLAAAILCGSVLL